MYNYTYVLYIHIHIYIKGIHTYVYMWIIYGPGNHFMCICVCVCVGLCLPMAGIAIAAAVVRYIAMYDIYTSCDPQNNILFLVLSILFSVTEPFFLFFSRNKDGGMPPRKQEFHYAEPKVTWSEPENR